MKKRVIHYLARLLFIFVLISFSVPICAYAQFSAVQTWGGTAGGTANAVTLTIHNITALNDLLGVPIRFLPATQNTSSATLTINLDGGGSLGPIAITVGLQALVGGELQPGVPTEFVYDGSGFALRIPSAARFIQNYLTGLTLSTAGSSSTFGVATGEAADSTNSTAMVLASAYTKTTASWVVGIGNGALDSGSIANTTWYHVFLMKRPDTRVVDICFSLSVSACTTGGAIPAAYTLFRRIGSMLTDSSAHWVLFTQVADEFLWAVPFQDANASAIGVAAALISLSTPPSVQCDALIRLLVNSINTPTVLFTSPDETSGAANSPVGNITLNILLANTAYPAVLNIRTNTSSQIRAIASAAAAASVATYGWVDRRGK